MARLAQISCKLETAEMRGLRTSARGALYDRIEQAELRRDFYDAHLLIDGLHKRFPRRDHVASLTVGGGQCPLATPVTRSLWNESRWAI